MAPGPIVYGYLGLDEIVITGESSCTNTFSSITEASCLSYTVPSGDETYTESALIMDTIPNAAGCDSILTIDLTITYPDIGIIASGSLLSSTATGGVSYQWMNCSDSSLVVGATEADFSPSDSGSYAVIVDDAGCVDTSSCASIVGVGLQEQEKLICVYPNPANNQINIILPDDVNGPISIISVNGIVVMNVANWQNGIDISGLANGTYVLQTMGYYPFYLGEFIKQ